MTATPFDLTGKVAVITGGNGGIGLGMAEALAAAGASVCIWGTNEAKNTAALANGCRRTGCRSPPGCATSPTRRPSRRRSPRSSPSSGGSTPASPTPGSRRSRPRSFT